MPSAVPKKRPAPTPEEAHAAIDVLGRLCAIYAARREQLAANAGLTEQQWEVLEEINTEHFMPSLFARRRESSAAAVSKIIRQLVDKRLISVSVSREDARHRHYVLTAKGKRAIASLREARQMAIEGVWLELNAEELRSFTDFGSELAGRLERYAQGTNGRE